MWTQIETVMMPRVVQRYAVTQQAMEPGGATLDMQPYNLSQMKIPLYAFAADTAMSGAAFVLERWWKHRLASFFS